MSLARSTEWRSAAPLDRGYLGRGVKRGARCDMSCLLSRVRKVRRGWLSRVGRVCFVAVVCAWFGLSVSGGLVNACVVSACLCMSAHVCTCLCMPVHVNACLSMSVCFLLIMESLTGGDRVVERFYVLCCVLSGVVSALKSILSLCRFLACPWCNPSFRISVSPLLATRATISLSATACTPSAQERYSVPALRKHSVSEPNGPLSPMQVGKHSLAHAPDPRDCDRRTIHAHSGSAALSVTLTGWFAT